jgi:hypothetical protein
MFRCLAFSLLLWLPLQWSWALASSPSPQACACGSALVIDMACHHADGPCPEQEGTHESGSGCCADCGHGQTLAGLLGAPVRLGCGTGEAAHGRYRLQLADPHPDRLLRPPAEQRR